MKTNLSNTKRLLILLPLIGLMAGCASTGNQGGVGSDISMEAGNASDNVTGADQGIGQPRKDALDFNNGGGGITRAH